MTRAESRRHTDAARVVVLELVARAPQRVGALHHAVQDALLARPVEAWYALQRALKELRAEGRVCLAGRASGTLYRAPTERA